MKYLIEYLPRIDCIQVQIEDDVDSVILKGLTPQEMTIECMRNNNTPQKLQQLNIKLPQVVLAAVEKNLQFIRHSKYMWSLRLKLDPKKNLSHKISTLWGSYDILLGSKLNKWSKKHLKSLKDFQFICDCCKFIILNSDTNCQRLNEMPSDNWVELMDYWHCHKPDTPIEHIDSSKQDLPAFSLSRYSTLEPYINEVLIDGSSFHTLLDTIKDKIKAIQQEGKTILRCIKCSNVLGERTASNNICKLYKWKLNLQCKQSNELDCYPPQNDVILKIWNYVTNYSGRYILLKCKDRKDLLIWIFALDIGVTLTDNVVYPNSVKILYVNGDNNKDHNTTKQGERLKDCNNENKTINVEEIDVSELPYEKFLAQLNNNNQLLPNAAQVFNKWRISYLPLT